MEELISELLRIEIDNEQRVFNGYTSSEAYTEYLTELYRKTNLLSLESPIYRNSIHIKLQDLELLLNINFPSRECVYGIERDYQSNPNLKQDVEWYRMLYQIRGIKEYYYQQILSMLNLPSDGEEQPKVQESHFDPEQKEEILTYEDLCKEYHFRGVKSVKDRKWREKNNFPYTQTGKYCAFRTTRSQVEEWLRTRKE